MKYISIFLLALAVSACSEQIKSDKKVQDEVMSSSSNETGTPKSQTLIGNNNLIVENEEDLIGNWVGWFEPDMKEDKILFNACRRLYQ